MPMKESTTIDEKGVVNVTTIGAAGSMVTTALALFVASVTEVAVMVTVLPVGTAGGAV
jgi:hypothetical protein